MSKDMEIQKPLLRLLKRLLRDSLWLLILAGVLSLALNRLGHGIGLAFVPLGLYWGFHWAAYLLGITVLKAMDRIDRKMIDSDRGRDISKHTFRVFLSGIILSLLSMIPAGLGQSWWLYLLSAGLFTWGASLGMMLPRSITHTKKDIAQ